MYKKAKSPTSLDAEALSLMRMRLGLSLASFEVIKPRGLTDARCCLLSSFGLPELLLKNLRSLGVVVKVHHRGEHTSTNAHVVNQGGHLMDGATRFDSDGVLYDKHHEQYEQDVADYDHQPEESLLLFAARFFELVADVGNGIRHCFSKRRIVKDSAHISIKSMKSQFKITMRKALSKEIPMVMFINLNCNIV